MPKDCPPVPLERVLRAELSEIQQVRAMRGNIGKTGEPRDPAAQPEAPIAGKANPSEPAWQTDEDTADWVQAIKEAHAANLVGLAFSGGGIRSATFNLGVLQALAELKLLHRIDYLSTVSGGGYIGGWLAAWTKRLGSFGEVQKRLATNRVHQIDDKEPPPIRFLRVFSNYLTPKLGILSGDTLAMASIYLRNMILNQVIVLAVLTFLLLLPRAVVNAISLTNGTQWNASVWAVAGGGLLLLAFLVIFNNMSFLDSREEHALTWLTKQFAILCLVGGPLFFVAILAALFLARESRAEELPFGRTAMWGAGIYAAVWLVVSAVAGGFDWWHRRRVEAGAKAAEAESKPGAVDPKQSTTSAGSISVLDRLGDFLITVLGAACAGALAGCLYAFLSKSWWCWCDQKALTIGAPMVLAIFLLAGALHIGLMGTVFHDAAREWWGRLGGWLLLWGVLWMAIFWVSLYFPDFIRNDKLVRAAWKAAAAKYLTPAWILTTLASVMAGKSTASGEPGKKTWNDWIAKVGPYVFITGLVCWISWCIDKIGHKYFLAAKAFRMQAASSDALDFFNFGHLAANWIKSYPIYAAILGCAALAMVMAWRVDVNQFSMHLFYRNRLVRCYLGASNENRSPNRFTGFDRTDDMPLKDLRKKSGYDGPYPIMNASLNLVKGKDLAWQERKAESFVMTPQFCGYDVWLEEQDSPLLVKKREEEGKASQEAAAALGAKGGAVETIVSDPGMNPRGVRPREFHSLDRFGYRPTALYAFPPPFDGPRLGLAMGVSGAAASPNMGFYSSAPVAFLMTLFDVRLGQWLGNPRHRVTWQRATPIFGLPYLLNELFAGTDDEAAYVYLSDGGHFENMGLYELVKRRCGLIIVCDAEADDCYGFAGLGNAIRKCRIDLGIDVVLDVSDITPKKTGEPSAKHCAIGKIHYEAVDKSAPAGTIIYFKASVTGDESTDIKNYHTAHPTFPHETTVDQWFTESQFESYRELGYHEVLTSLNPQPPASVSSGGDALLSGLKPQDASVIQAAAMTQTAGEAPWPDTAEGEQALRDKKKSKLVPQCKQMKDSLERFGFDVSRLQSGGWKSS